MSSELENSGIRVAVGDCSVTERRRWRPPYQAGKTVHMHAKHYKHNEDRRTAPGVCGNGSVPLSHSGNVVTRTGIHTHTLTQLLLLNRCTDFEIISQKCSLANPLQNCSNGSTPLNKMAARAINRKKLYTTSSAKSVDRF